jgi:hypothetical protein
MMQHTTPSSRLISLVIAKKAALLLLCGAAVALATVQVRADESLPRGDVQRAPIEDDARPIAPSDVVTLAALLTVVIATLNAHQSTVVPGLPGLAPEGKRHYQGTHGVDERPPAPM